MMLLDTNILSEMMKADPEPGLVKFLDQQPEPALFISAITRAEIELGIALLPNGKKKRALDATANAIFELFTGRCLAFGELAATRYADIVSTRTQLGRPISVEDAQIAAIAVTHDLKLVTRNTRDFEQIADLETINPWSVQT